MTQLLLQQLAFSTQAAFLVGAATNAITADRAFSAAVLRGGSGNDTIILGAGAASTLDKSTIGGNDNADLIKARSKRFGYFLLRCWQRKRHRRPDFLWRKRLHHQRWCWP